MTKEQLDHMESRLLEEREKALEALAQFDEQFKVSMQEQDGDLNSYDQHQADQGTDTMQSEKDYLLASKEGRLVYWIDDALRTLYKEPENFGRCQDCGEQIPGERLEIVPWARLCIGCQEKDEGEEVQAA